MQRTDSGYIGRRMLEMALPGKQSVFCSDQPQQTTMSLQLLTLTKAFSSLIPTAMSKEQRVQRRGGGGGVMAEMKREPKSL